MGGENTGGTNNRDWAGKLRSRGRDEEKDEFGVSRQWWGVKGGDELDDETETAIWWR